jgi:hypothetical protein
MPKVCPHTALVFHLPVAAAQCMVYDVDVAAGWGLAQLCQDVRLARRRKDLAVPRVKATTLDPGKGGPAVVTEAPPSLADQIDAARTVEELSALWRTHRPEWTAALTERGLKRRDQLLAESAGEG